VVAGKGGGEALQVPPEAVLLAVDADQLVTTAESVTGTVDSASRLAYIAMANPVIKGVAFASGTAKAARRLRGRKGEGDEG